MTQVKFLKSWRFWAKNEETDLPEVVAKNLVAGGFAVRIEADEVIQPVASYDPKEETEGLSAEKPRRKIGRPRKKRDKK